MPIIDNDFTISVDFSLQNKLWNNIDDLSAVTVPLRKTKQIPMFPKFDIFFLKKKLLLQAYHNLINLAHTLYMYHNDAGGFHFQ